MGLMSLLALPPKAHAEFTPILNLKASYPQKASAEFGVIFGNVYDSDWAKDARGIVLSVEPGLSGTKAHLGYGVFGAGVGVGVASARITATYMRATESTGSLDKGDDYAGLQVTASFFFVVGTVGVLRNTSRNDYLATAGIGIGW